MPISLAQYKTYLTQYLAPQKRRIVLLTVLLFSDIGLQLVNPQIIRHFIDLVKSTGPLQTLTTIALIYIGVSLVQQGLAIWTTYVSEIVSWAATNALRSDLARHCLRLDMSFHNAHTPGEMIERIDGDINALSNFFSRFLIQILGSVLLLLGILILLFYEDWRAGLGLTVFVTLAFTILIRCRNIAVPHWEAVRQASADMFGFLEDRLAGTEDIRANRAKPYVLRRFYELTRDWLKKEIKSALMVNIMVVSQVILYTMGNAAALAIGAYLYREGTLSIGAVYLLFHYTNMLIRPIEMITFQLQDLQRAGASVGRVHELTRIESKLPPGKGDPLPEGTLSVSFQNVSFGYAETEPVLKDLSFHLAPGRVLGLLGRTGSGKTTLTRLLFRLYDPDQGAVCLGETDVRYAHLPDLRNRIAMVTQNVQLFQASVRDNLTLFDPQIPDRRVQQTLSELGMDAWINALPDGLDTELAAEGGGVSAGEAQLLAFARIFLLKDPDLVILDEASSRLDPATEQLLEHAVDRLVQGRTAIIIAHRLGTVRRASDIMILDDGRIQEHGPRNRLERDPDSRFYALLQTGLEDVLV